MHASILTATVREANRSTMELRAAQQGLFLGASGQAFAANVAERPARVETALALVRLAAPGRDLRWSDVSGSPALSTMPCGISTGQASGQLGKSTGQALA